MNSSEISILSVVLIFMLIMIIVLAMGFLDHQQRKIREDEEAKDATKRAHIDVYMRAVRRDAE